jgi:hypothetical protein
MRTTFKKAAGVGVLAASIVTIGTVASAAPEPTVNACVGKLTGLVRIIDPAKQSCSGLEKPLSWNQRGVPGPAGAAGPAGPAGVTGPTGPQGPAGGDNVLWARAQLIEDENGDLVFGLAAQKHATAVGLGGAFNHYRVTFDRAVDQCAAQVTPLGDGGYMGSVSYLGLPANVLDVSLWVPGHDTAVPGAFVITVNC